MPIILALALSIAIVSSLYSFQSSEPPAPKRGAIFGHVLQSKSGDPVKKALVILKRGQEAGTGVSTDSSGAFRFDDLETGSYTISAERKGFVLDPESERSVVNVKPQPDESEITLKLIRTGAISGQSASATPTLQSADHRRLEWSCGVSAVFSSPLSD